MRLSHPKPNCKQLFPLIKKCLSSILPRNLYSLSFHLNLRLVHLKYLNFSHIFLITHDVLSFIFLIFAASSVIKIFVKEFFIVFYSYVERQREPEVSSLRSEKKMSFLRSIGTRNALEMTAFCICSEKWP